MTRKLSIESIDATSFGGLHNRHIAIPGSGLVVVHGGNEAGKSTLAELAAWLLAGPATGKGAGSRFGVAGDELSGSLKGRFADSEFTVDARFKLNKTGVSTKSPQVFRHGTDLDLEQWRRSLGGIDDKVFAGIYRLWGQDLHIGDDVGEQLNRVGLGALGGSADPRSAADNFDAAAKFLATSHASGAISVAALKRELEEAAAQLREAAGNIESHRRLLTELEGHKGRHNRVDERRKEFSKLEWRLKSSSSVLEQFDHRAIATKKLEQLSQLPDGWAEVIVDMPRFKSAWSELDTAKLNLANDERELNQYLVNLEPGNPSAARKRVARLSLTSADLNDVLAEVTNIKAARANITDAQTALETAQTDCSKSAESLAVSLKLIATDRTTLKATRLDLGSCVTINSSADIYLAAEKSISEAEDAEAEAGIALNRAESEMLSAKNDWINLGLGPDPVKWSIRAGSTGRQGATAFSYLPAALVVALAAAAAALGQWPLAAGGAVVAVVIAFWNSRTSSSDPGLVDFEIAEEIAQRFLGRVEAHNQAVVGLKEAEARCENERISLKRDLEKFVELVTKFGLGLPTDPVLIESALNDWIAAQKLLDGVRSDEAAARQAETHLDKVKLVQNDHIAALAELLRSGGLPENISPDSAHSMSQAYFEAAAALGKAESSSVRVEECIEKWEVVVAPVKSLITDRSSEWIRVEALAMAKLNGERAEVVAEIDKAQGDIDLLLSNDTELMALVDELQSTSDIELRLSRLATDLESANTELEGISGEIWRCEQEIDELSSESRIADIRADQGSKAELQAEVAFESAANVLAGALARQVAEEFERKHQPDVVKKTAHLATEVAGEWAEVIVKPSNSDELLMVRRHDGGQVPVSMLSTGARALLYLSLRLAMADHDGDNRQAEMPLLCDDPLVHLDDQRAERAVRLLADAAKRRQVIIFTCHSRTVESAVSAGAEIATL